MVESLSAKNLYVSSGAKKILNRVSLELKKGDLGCLCGQNGCGKSTLLSVMAGVQASGLKVTAEDNGFLPRIDSVDIKTLPPKSRAQKIAYMAQNETSMWDFTVFDIVLSGRFSYTKSGNYSQVDKDAAQNAINQLGISHLAQKSVFEISYGEFQKARIARTLCQIVQNLRSKKKSVYENPYVDTKKYVLPLAPDFKFPMVHFPRLELGSDEKILYVTETNQSENEGDFVITNKRCVILTKKENVEIPLEALNGVSSISSTVIQLNLQEEKYYVFMAESQVKYALAVIKWLGK